LLLSTTICQVGLPTPSIEKSEKQEIENERVDIRSLYCCVVYLSVMCNCMTLRITTYLILFFASATLFAQSQVIPKSPKLDVTGSYKYVGKTVKKGEDVYGYFGEIKVKQLENGNIAVSFYLCKGAKSYNSGSFVDTLAINGNIAVYRASNCDSLCTLTFHFAKGGVTTIHKAANDDYNFSCCFGQRVIANGFFRKTSSKAPLIKDPLTD
jgi:hypothetical protein